MKIAWRPVPGMVHKTAYLEADIERLAVELFFSSGLLHWEWSVYDPDSYEPDLAVTRDNAYFRDNAEADLREWVGDYLGIILTS